MVTDSVMLQSPFGSARRRPRTASPKASRLAPLGKGAARAALMSAANALGLAREARLAVNEDKLT